MQLIQITVQHIPVCVCNNGEGGYIACYWQGQCTDPTAAFPPFRHLQITPSLPPGPTQLTTVATPSSRLFVATPLFRPCRHVQLTLFHCPPPPPTTAAATPFFTALQTLKISSSLKPIQFTLINSKKIPSKSVELAKNVFYVEAQALHTSGAIPTTSLA